MFDGSFVREIAKMSGAKLIETELGQYSTDRLYKINEQMPECITMFSLSGLVDLVKAESELYQLPLFLRITSPNTVDAFGTIRNDKQRETPFRVSAELPEFRFGCWYDIEDMIIRLKTAFLPTEDRDYIIKLIGNITDQKSVQTKDDGVSQSVTVQAGISMMGETKVKPIVSLKPYRTFLEVDQPESEFLIRLRNGEAALFEADGGAWKQEAKANIAKFLKDKLKDMVGVIVIE